MSFLGARASPPPTPPALPATADPATALASLPGLAHLWAAAHVFLTTSPELSRHYIAELVDAAQAAGVELPGGVRQAFCPCCSSLFATPANISVRSTTHRAASDARAVLQRKQQQPHQQQPPMQQQIRQQMRSPSGYKQQRHRDQDKSGVAAVAPPRAGAALGDRGKLGIASTAGSRGAKHRVELRCRVCSYRLRHGVKRKSGGDGNISKVPLQLPGTPLQAVCTAAAFGGTAATPAAGSPAVVAACSAPGTPHAGGAGEKKRKKKKKRDSLATILQRGGAGMRKKTSELSLSDFLSSI